MQYEFNQLYEEFYDLGRVKKLQSVKANAIVYVLVTTGLVNEELIKIKLLKTLLAKNDNYVVDEMDLQILNEKMENKKIILILNAIKGQEGEKIG